MTRDVFLLLWRKFSEAVNGSGIGGSEWKRGKRRREEKERGGVREEVW